MHTAIANHLREHLPGVTIEQVPWRMPTRLTDAVPDAPTTPAAQEPGDGMTTLVFPASALPRKGWLELCAALHQLDAASRLPALRLHVLGSLPPNAARPPEAVEITVKITQGKKGAPANHFPPNTCALVLPAHIEHAPRTALHALALGIPVLATPACGLPAHPLLTPITAGDSDMLAQQLHRTLASAMRPVS